MQTANKVDIFLDKFNRMHRVIVPETKQFASTCNILLFCLTILQHASEIAHCDLDEGREFVKGLYEEIMTISTVEPKFILDTFDELKTVKDENIRVALQYFQSFGNFIRMRTKYMPSIETICLLFIADISSKKVISEFLRSLSISTSYTNCLKFRTINNIQLNKSVLTMTNKKLPNVILRKTPVNKPFL